MPTDRLVHKDLTEKIIGAAMEVHNTLGGGFLEKVYENALAKELRHRGLKVEQQKSITVYYKGDVVGDYVADLIVQDTVIIELKAVERLSDVHKAQMLHYLVATKLEVGLIMNFQGRLLDWQRCVLQTARN